MLQSKPIQTECIFKPNPSRPFSTYSLNPKFQTMGQSAATGTLDPKRNLYVQNERHIRTAASLVCAWCEELQCTQSVRALEEQMMAPAAETMTRGRLQDLAGRVQEPVAHRRAGDPHRALPVPHRVHHRGLSPAASARSSSPPSPLSSASSKASALGSSCSAWSWLLSPWISVLAG